MGEETRFVSAFKEKLNRIPGACFTKVAQKVTRGDPDLWGHINGVAVYIEAKTNTRKLTKLQAIKLNRLRATGALCFVVRPDNQEQVLEFLTTLGNGGYADEYEAAVGEAITKSIKESSNKEKG